MDGQADEGGVSAMRMICRMLLLPMILTAIASLAMAQLNRRVTTNPDSSRAQTNPTPEPTPQVLELRCRGGGLQINVTQGEMRENDLWMNMTIHFKRASDAAGTTGQSLAPGQCALPDRAVSASEPTEMRAEVINFGQRNRQMHGDPVYKGDQAAEKYPHAQNIPPYLSNPNHYWSFFGFNTFDGYFRITTLHYWKPASGPTSTERLQTPGRGGNKRVEAPASSITQGDPDPIPANAVRIYIRYSKELGYLSTKAGGLTGTAGPYSCDAFKVEAIPNAGLGSSTSSSGTSVRGIANPNTMRTEGSYYVCGFTVEYLPQNQPITVSAGM